MYIMYIWIHIDHFRNALETSRSSSPLDFGALPFIRPPSWRDQHQNVAKKKKRQQKNSSKWWKKYESNQSNHTKMYQNVSKCWVLRYENKHVGNRTLGFMDSARAKSTRQHFQVWECKKTWQAFKKGRSMAICIIKTDEKWQMADDDQDEFFEW